MDIYLLRHGDALPAGAPGVASDDERPLSDKGVEGIRAVAAALRALNIDPDRIASSPLVRARQTADLVASGLGGREVDLWEELGHGFSPASLLKRLRGLGSGDTVILVGHQPDLGEFAAFLIFGDTGADVTLKKGGVCRISFEKKPSAGEGCLEWLLTGKQLAALKSGDAARGAAS